MTTLIPKIDLKNGGTTPAGAINRTVNEKLQDTVSVKDFGAINDWNGTSGTDNTAFFQAAFDYAMANNKAIYVPGGNSYYLTGGLTVGGTRVYGDFNTTLLWPSTFQGTAITVNTYNTQFENLNLWKINPSSVPTAGFCIDVQKHYCWLTNVNITGISGTYNGWYNAIRFLEYSHTARNCTFSGYANGVVIGANNVVIDSSYCQAVVTACIYIDGGAANSIVNCDIEGNGTYGIFAYASSSSSTIQGLNISGNYIEQYGASAQDIAISGVSSSYPQGGISITGNYLALSGGGANAINIQAQNTNGLTITGNRLNGSSSTAIDLKVFNVNASVFSNQIPGGQNVVFEDTWTNPIPVTGIVFPATDVVPSNSNTLYDYETGTWTPTQGTFSATGTFTSRGTYTKIGNQVYCNALLGATTSISGSSGNYFGGLPFVPNDSYVGVGLNATFNSTNAIQANTSSQCTLSGSISGSYIQFSFTYLTNN
jgi:hypothetical protein